MEVGPCFMGPGNRDPVSVIHFAVQRGISSRIFYLGCFDMNWLLTSTLYVLSCQLGCISKYGISKYRMTSPYLTTYLVSFPPLANGATHEKLTVPLLLANMFTSRICPGSVK